jgi:hypothetical protein
VKNSKPKDRTELVGGQAFLYHPTLSLAELLPLLLGKGQMLG